MAKDQQNATANQDQSAQEEVFQVGQVIDIAGIPHIVEYNFLKNKLDPSDHGKIFKVLNIPDKEGFCKKHYGYHPYPGCFPQTRPGDNLENLKAITKVAKALITIATKQRK